MRWHLPLLIFLVPRLSVAENLPVTTLATIPTGNDIMVPLRKGQVAPFDGQLFDNDTALRWGFWIKQSDALSKQAVDRQKKECEIETEYTSTLTSLNKERDAKVEADLKERLQASQQALQDAQDPPWYRSNGFHFALGVLSSVAVVSLTAWAYHEVK